ncbi:MAG TPA: nucleoside triphosphate pyrophosphohydrolase [Thermoanaerobaculia bacterium]|nr:nucleoside triphosphate pyrophosphohydrolase [Thermoanaerobaculia bacterium]
MPSHDRSKAPPGQQGERPRSPTDLARLLELVARLRAPDGCPWDREQTLADARGYLIEEAHEAAAAAAAGDWDALAGELGDLLFQVAFIARLGEESGALDPGELIGRIHAKMVARHPHVFGGESAQTAEEVLAVWERRKLAAESGRSLLEGVPQSLPPLVAAYRMTQKAAGVGFDWPDSAAVLEKLDEELAELRAGIAGGDRATVRGELGDLLFTAVNLARKLGVDPDGALAETNAKFRRRFRYIEERLADRGRSLADVCLEELDRLWEEAKETLSP